MHNLYAISLLIKQYKNPTITKAYIFNYISKEEKTFFRQPHISLYSIFPFS